MLVGLDVDGVISNFYRSMCEKYGESYETKIDKYYGIPFIDDNFKYIIDDVDFWDNLHILNDPTNINFEFEYYITSLPPKMFDSRVKWLNKHGFPDKPVIVTEDKLNKCKELGVEILIDDKPTTIEQFNDDPDLHIIQFIPEYTKFKPITEYYTRDLNTIDELITKIKINEKN